MEELYFQKQPERMGDMPDGCCGSLNSKMLSDVNLEMCAKLHTSANEAFSEQTSCCE